MPDPVTIGKAIADRAIAKPTTRPRLVALERATARAIRRRYGTRIWATTPLPVRALAGLLIARESRRVQRRAAAKMLATLIPTARKIGAAIRQARDETIAQARQPLVSVQPTPTLKWSTEASVLAGWICTTKDCETAKRGSVSDTPTHCSLCLQPLTERVLNAFQMNTYAVVARYPDRSAKVRVLPRGERGRRPNLPADQGYAAELLLKFATQTQPVVFEEDQGRPVTPISTRWPR